MGLCNIFWISFVVKDEAHHSLFQVANVDEMASRSGMTALHYAAWNGRSDAVEWLLSHGASANVTDSVQGNTPLHWAASNSREESFQVIDSLIIEGGADAQRENQKGDWPIGLADKGGHHELAKAIVTAIRKSATIRMGVHKSIKTALLKNQQSSNGATMFHFFAAYGMQEDLEWLFALQSEMLQDDTAASASQDKPTHELRDKDNRTVVHWAGRLANKGALRVLAENKVDLHAGLAPGEPHKTPLSVAILKGDMEFAHELLKCKPRAAEDWLSDTNRSLEDYYRQKREVHAKFESKFMALQDGFQRHTRRMKVLVNKNMFLEMPPIFLALYADREDIAMFIQQYSTGVEDAVNFRGGMRWTALHWATFLEQREIVSTLCRSKHFAPFLTANVEDKLGRTVLHYAKQMKLGDIENELMQRSDVKVYVDGLYKDRQLYVDAANAILVGAALIASVTFVGWLQPPLNYTPYYNLPPLPSPPSPPNIYQSYAAIQQNAGVRCFWIFNSLSFTMAISTMLAGLVGVAPIPRVLIAISVKPAGFAVLPPLFEYQANMMATMIVGGVPCLGLLVGFAGRLWSFRSRWLRNLEAAVVVKLRQIRPTSTDLPAGEAPREDQHDRVQKTDSRSKSSNDVYVRVGRRYRERMASILLHKCDAIGFSCCKKEDRMEETSHAF